MSKRIFLTTADMSPWTAPADFNPNSNTVEVIAGGGGGGKPVGNGGGGGGGGAYSKASNVPVAAGGTAVFQVGAGGAGGINGTAGTDTWFNGASLVASTVGAKGGLGATGGTGGAGGIGNNGTGTTRFSGGNGGTYGSGSSACGGGGAAGPNGDGFSANSAGSGNGTNGGGGDQGFGGAGGAADAGGAGGAGTEWDASHGSGGGGGGGSINGGAGGAYGGGGGGANSGSAGAGRDGLIVITYTPDPQLVGGWYQNTNIPARFGQNFTAAGSGSTFTVPMVPPQLFWTFAAELEYAFTKKFPVTEQQFGAISIDLPAQAPIPKGWQGDFGAQFAKPFPVGDQHFTSVRTDQPPSAAPQLFWGYSAYNYVLLPFEVTEQQFISLVFPSPATAATPQGWAGSFEPIFKKPLSPALQQFIATRIEQPAAHASQVWGYSASDEVLLPFEACYQQFSDVPFTLFPALAIPQGWRGDFGYAFAKPLSVTQQSFIGLTPQGNIPTTATPQGWVGDIGVGFVKPLSAAQQSFIGFTPQGNIASVATPIGGWNVTPSYAFAKPFSVAQQQFSATRIDTPPTTSINPLGWVSSLEYAFAKARPVNLNPWLGYFTAGSVPTAPVKYGWWGYQPERFTQQFPVAFQQYFAFQPQGMITVQAPAVIDPYIYPGDKKAKQERDKLLAKQPYDPRKLTRKQRKLIAQFEARRWEQITEGPTRAEKMHEDMKAAVAEVLAAAEKKRIEDAKVSGLFGSPPPVALEASLHAAIRVVKELERQHELDEARKALVRAKQEALAQAERDIVEAKERERTAKLAALKAKKATADAKLLTRYKMKKKLEADEINDAVFNSLKSTRLGRDERAEILESVLDIARRRK